MDSDLQQVAIVTDSVTCLPAELKERYRIITVPVNIVFNNRVYRDGIDMTTEQAFEMLKDERVHFASSPAPIGEYIKAFQQAGVYAKSILCVTLSAKLSTMYNVAKLAREQAKSVMPGVSIEVVDSGSAAIAEGLIVSGLAQAAEEGKSLGELVGVAAGLSEKVRLGGVLETIRYVYRTGRVPKFSAKLGSLANIKPVFSISEGELRIAGISMSREAGIKRMIDDMRKAVKNRSVHVAVAHADAPEAGQKLKDKIESDFRCVEIWLTAFSPVIAYAAGPGVLAVAYYAE